MKYKYEVMTMEDTGRKIMSYYLNDKDKLPDTELEELIIAFLGREDVRTLNIKCKDKERLYALKRYIKHLLHVHYKISDGTPLYWHIAVHVNEAMSIKKRSMK